MSDDLPLAAGSFSAWLLGMQQAMRGERPADVPCNGCTACCTSSQFVNIEPDETETRAHIPAPLLFPAPRRPPGHVLLGYDEHGRCPMLVDGGCSIYEHRPRACRTYDCRIFPAAGVELEGEDQLAIARRGRRWRFSYPSERDQVEHDAVRAAARYVADHGDLLPEGSVPTSGAPRAALAIHLHDAFLADDAKSGRRVVVEPKPEAVRVRMTSRRRSPRPSA